MKIIAVTGTPGAGKTAISKNIAKRLNYYYVDANKLIHKNSLHEGFDKKRKTKIVNVDKLKKFLIDYINRFKRSTGTYRGMVIDSHLSHYVPKKYINICIVAKCDIKVLNKRLNKRKYAKNKIIENLQSEIFDVCYNEALQQKHKVIVINTTKSFNISSLAKKLGGGF